MGSLSFQHPQVNNWLSSKYPQASAGPDLEPKDGSLWKVDPLARRAAYLMSFCPAGLLWECHSHNLFNSCPPPR